MGVDQKVVFAPEKAPTWPALVEFLAVRKYPLQMRLIDGDLAFPDETPPEGWRELRVATPDGMVALRRDPDGITLVTWGNADPKLRQAWNGLAWALAQLSEGTVGGLSAEEFRKSAELPEALRG
jgi:hypothetical protein